MGGVEKLSLLLADERLRRRMGSNGKIASARYSIDVVIRMWEDLFVRLLSAAEPSR